jgi:hypothetical protein
MNPNPRQSDYKPINLVDACRLRSHELTRVLAGAVVINPLAVLPLIDKLRPESLTDNAAKKFILAMKDRLPELQISDNDHQGIIFIEWATDNHLLFDLALWMNEVRYSIEDAKNAVKELQKLAIALNALEGLQDWIKAREEYIYGR